MIEGFWTTIAAVLGSSAASIAILTFLAKNLLKHFLEKDRDAFKVQLETTSTRAIEEMKAHLTRLSTEHQVRFNLLHTKRADLIAELYEHIQNAYNHTLSFVLGAETTSIEHKAKSAEAAHDAVRQAFQVLGNRKIWLSEPLARQSQDLLIKLSGPSLRYHYFAKKAFSEQDVLTVIASWKENQKEIEKLMAVLEKEYRSELTGTVTLKSANPPANPRMEPTRPES